MNQTNYHSHCTYCDGRADMATFARWARAKGFSAYGFSSHAPLPFPTAWTMEWDRMDDYLAELNRLKRRYEGAVELYAALEIDYLNDEWNPASEWFQALSLDYRIGSVHLLYDAKGNVVDGDLPAPKFAKMVLQHFQGDIETVVKQYFDRANRMLQLGGFQILGHADKVHYNAEWYSPHIVEQQWYVDMVQAHLAEAVRQGYFIEINTKAYNDLGVFYPDKHYFSFLHALGARVVVNSDAHYPDCIESGRTSALQALSRAGFSHVAELHNGKWSDVPIAPSVSVLL